MKKLFLFACFVLYVIVAKAQCTVNYGLIAPYDVVYCSPVNPQPITFLSPPSGGSGTFTYQWYYKAAINSCPTGGNITTGWTLISGATASSYDPPAGLTEIRTYACMVTPVNAPGCSAQWAGGGCPEYVPFLPGAPLAYVDQDTFAICPNGNPPAIEVTPDVLQASLQWYYKDGVNAAPSGSSTTGWTIISGATGITYDPPTGLAASRTYGCFVTPDFAVTNCSPKWANNAYVVAVVDTTTINYGTVDTTTVTVCPGAGVPLLSMAQNAIGPGNVSFTYQWYYKDGLVSAPTGSSTTGWTLNNNADVLINRTYACFVSLSIGCGNHWANGVKKIKTIMPAQVNWGQPGLLADTVCNNETAMPVQMLQLPSGPSSFSYKLFESDVDCNITNPTPVYTGTGAYQPANNSQSYLLQIASPGCGAPVEYCYKRYTANPDVPLGDLSCFLFLTNYYRNFCGEENSTIRIDMCHLPTEYSPDRSFNYQWYYKPGIVDAPATHDGTNGWTIIPGATQSFYDAPPGGTTGTRTYAVRILPVMVNNCPVATGWAFGACYIADGTQNLYGTITGTQTVCSLNQFLPVTFSTLPLGPPITPGVSDNLTKLRWYYKDGIVPAPDPYSSLTGWTAALGTDDNNSVLDFSSVAGSQYTTRTYAAYVTPANTICPPNWATGVAQVTVNPNLAQTGVLAGNQSICLGGVPQAITFSTPPSGGSGNYSYQWYCTTNGSASCPIYTTTTAPMNEYSEWAIITGATSSSYTPPTGASATRKYICFVKDLNNSSCTLVKLPTCVTVTVASTVSYGKVSPTSSGIIVSACAGTSIQPYDMVELPSSDNAFTYQWYYVNGVTGQPTGGSTAGWTPVSGATSATLSLGTAPTETRTYACFITPTQPNYCGTVIAGNWAGGFYRVVTGTINYGIVSAEPATVCAGSSILVSNGLEQTLGMFLTLPSYGGLTTGFTYQWYYKDGVVAAPSGSSTSGWTILTGQTASTLQMPTLTANTTRTYACIVTPPTTILSCYAAAWATGARVIYVTPIPLSTNGTIVTDADTICTGTIPPTVYMSVVPVATIGSISYNWFYKAGQATAPTGSSIDGWTFISTTTSPVLTYPSTITQSITIACYITLTNGITCTAEGGIWANGCRYVTVSSTEYTAGSLTADGSNVVIELCGNDPAAMSFNTLPLAPGLTYQWYYRDYPGLLNFDNFTLPTYDSYQIATNFTLIPGATSFTYDPPAGTYVNRVYKCVVRTNSTVCTSGWLNGYEVAPGAYLVEVINDNGLPADSLPTVNYVNDIICSGGDPLPITLDNTETGEVYLWYYKDGINQCPDGNSTTGWTVITGPDATTVTIDPASGLTTSRTYACLVAKEQCTVPQWANSCRQVTVTNANNINYGTITSITVDNCTNNSTIPLSFATLPSGASSFTYQWYSKSGSNTCPSGSSTAGWTIVTGATTPTYSIGNLPASATYACFVTPVGPAGCIGSGAWAAGCRKYLITTTPTQYYWGSSPGDTLVADGGASFTSLAIPYTITPAGGSNGINGPQTQWYYQAGIVACPSGSSTAGWTSTSTVVSTQDIATYARYVTIYNCNNVATGSWASGCFTIYSGGTAPYYAGTLAAGNQTVCAAEMPNVVSFSALPAYNDENCTYKWYKKTGIQSAPTAGATVSGWTFVSTTTTPDFYPPATSSSVTYACYVTKYNSLTNTSSSRWANGCRQITAAPTANTATYGTINNAGESLCIGADPVAISFSSLPTNIPGGYTFQWYKNSATSTCPGTTVSGWDLIPGATSSSYDPPAGINVTTRYACRIIPNAAMGCIVINAGWATNCWVVTITPPVTVSYGTLSSSGQTICPGDDPNSFALSTLPSGSGYTFAYQWYYRQSFNGVINYNATPAQDNWTLIPGATTSSYDPPVPGNATTTFYACYVTATPAPNTCNYGVTSGWAANSRPVTFHSTSTYSFGTLTSGNETLCPGGNPANITFSTAPSGGATYQWYYADGAANAPSGNNITGWNLISGATTNSYDPPTGLNNTRSYACLVSHTICGTNYSLWSSGIRIVTVYGAVSYGSIDGSPWTLCSGGDPGIITMLTTPTTTSTYQWYYQDGIVSCPSGSSTSGWTIIGGATSNSYNPPSNLTVSRTYALKVTQSTSCGSLSAWADNCKQVTIGTAINFGSITQPQQTVCHNTDIPAISLSTIPTGGGGSYTYAWYYQDAIVNCPTGSSTVGWTAISNSNSSIYNPPAELINNKTFACLVTTSAVNGCTATSGWATGCAKYTTQQLFVNGVVTNSDLTICDGENPAAFTLGTPASMPGAAYQWRFSSSSCFGGTLGSPGNIVSGQTSATLDLPAGASDGYYFLSQYIAGDNTCPAFYIIANNCGRITTGDEFNAGYLDLNGETVCLGGDPSAITFSSQPAQTYVIQNYKWYYKDGLVVEPLLGDTTTANWTFITTTTVPTYNPPAGLNTDRTYACKVTGTCGTATQSAWAGGARWVNIGGTGGGSLGTLATGNQSLCSGGDPSAITFSSLPSGGTNITYQWYYQNGLVTCPSGSSTSGWTIISGATSSSYDPPTGLTQTRTYACFVSLGQTSCGSPTGWATQCRQVTINPAATFGTLATGNETICSGGNPANITFATTPSGGSGNYTYQWYYQDGLITCPSGSNTSGWTIISGATTSSYDPPTGLAANLTYACLVTATAGNGCNASTGWATQCRQVTITTNPTINYGTLTSGNESFCATGDPSNITFATLPSGGGGTFTYQWYYQNGLITCPTGSSTSGWTIISGATASNYDAPSGLTQSRTYACMVTVTGACISGNQWATNCRQVTITTPPTVNYGTLTTGNESFCLTGDPTNITFATAPSGGTFTYQWYYQDGLITCPTGSSTSGWTIISGATASNYDAPSGLTQSRTYACMVTVTGACVSGNSWASNCRQVTITPAATFGTLTTGNESFCATGDPSSITFATIPSGGSNTFTYQWYYQDGLISCPAGSSTSGWTIISGATTASYNPPSGLTASRTYACLVTATAGGGCTASTQWASQCRQVTINPQATFGTLALNNETICTGGDPVAIVFATVPAGGSGSFTYQWYYQDGLITCPTGSSTLGWTIISGGTAASYDPPTGLTTNRTYACLVTAIAGNGCTATTSWATQCRQVTVSANPTVNYGTLTAANESFCNTGDPTNITFATAPSGGGGTFTYQWYYQDGLVTCPTGTSTAGWTIIGGATASNYDAPSGLTQSRTYACMVITSGACVTGNQWVNQCRQVTINTLPAVNYGALATAAETFCNTGDPANIVFSTPPSGGSGTQTYQWYYQDGIITCPTGSSTSGWTIISGATASSYDPTSITASRTYACLVSDAGIGTCPATLQWATNCRQVTVNAVAYGTIANGAETICINGNPAAITFATVPTGGGTITYQWYYRNGVQVCPTGNSIFGMVLIAGATSATYDPPAGLNQTRTYACMVNIAAGNGCPASNNWAANCRIVTVTPLPNYGTLDPNTKRICKGGNPDPLVFQILPSGGTTYTYQWYYKNGQSLVCPSGTNTTGWTLIPGGTAQNYDPPAGLTTTRTYACMVTVSGNGTCSNGTRWATNCVIQTVVPPPTYGTLANGNESVCSGGNPAAITFSTAPAGYGTKTYQWYYKDGVSGNCPTGSSTSGWTSITGATTNSYDPPAGLTTSRTYACMVTATGTPCAGSQWATNCRKVTIITCREDDYIGFGNDLPQDDKADSYNNASRPQLDEPVLEQNMPNPFTETTSITCTLNKVYSSAVIRIVNVLGEELMLKKLTSPGVNKIEVNRGTLTPGIYFYSLYLDGKLYDTKRMVVTH